jgi:predicted aspartyl protease
MMLQPMPFGDAKDRASQWGDAAVRSTAIFFVLIFSLLALPAVAGCGGTESITLPLISGNRPVVQAVLDGQQLPMLVDTGAQRSAVSSQTAELLGLQADQRRTRLDTIGGVKVTNNVLLNSLALGGRQFAGLSMAVIDFPSTAEHKPAGIVGADVLSQYNVEFDFPHRTMTLYPQEACARPLWRGAYEKLPIDTAGGRLLFPVALNDHRLTAEFDTGSRGETVAEAAAERIGISATDLDNDPAKSGTTLAGLYAIRRHQFASFRIANETFQNIKLDVASLQQPNVDMLVGADYMHWRRFFVSYSGQALFVQKESGSPDNASNPKEASAAPGELCHPPQGMNLNASPPPRPLARPHFRLPDSIRLNHITGCAGIAFHLSPEGQPTDVRLIFERPPGYGVGNFVKRQVAATLYPPPDDPRRLYYLSIGLRIIPSPQQAN